MGRGAELVRRRCAAMKQISKILLACSGLGFLCFASFFVFAHAVPTDKLSRVTVGMTEAQVESIVGSPQYVRHESAGGTALGYGGFLRLKWCSVEINLGADGKVAGSVFHDH